MAKKPKVPGLGLNLGLKPKGREALTTAMQGGEQTFSDYMASHPIVTRKLGRLETKRPQSKAGQQWASYQQQYNLTPVKAPPSTNPALTDPNQGAVPAADTTPTPGSTADPNWWRNFVSPYEMGMPSELQTVADTATANLKRLDAMPLPSYQEQFNTYKDLMERELDRQTADLTESFGARGGRYSSDLLTASNTMRRQGLQDLSAQGIQAMQTLNAQRMQELGGTLNLLSGVGASRGNIAESGANRAWQSYLMQTSPPEMMDKMLSWSASFTPPGSVVTQK